jgi:exonuclease III
MTTHECLPTTHQSEHHAIQSETHTISETGRNTTTPGADTRRQPDNPTPPEHENLRKKKPKKQRANIKIATLNINGCHIQGEAPTSFEKWAEINATIKREKIAILALQETHLDQNHADTIQQVFPKRLEIYNSELDYAPRTSAGVAFIINREAIDPTEIKWTELIKGRAVALSFKWKGSETTLINVYAPNNRNDNERFWKKLQTRASNENIPNPDFLLGDFNITEDPIDRSPPKHDNASAVDALRELRRKLNVHDKWRHTYSKAREFTYRATHNQKQIKSRLDWIYTGSRSTPHTYGWTITPSTVLTDHWMASVKFALKDAPHIGKG